MLIPCLTISELKGKMKTLEVTYIYTLRPIGKPQVFQQRRNLI